IKIFWFACNLRSICPTPAAAVDTEVRREGRALAPRGTAATGLWASFRLRARTRTGVSGTGQQRAQRHWQTAAHPHPETGRSTTGWIKAAAIVTTRLPGPPPWHT